MTLYRNVQSRHVQIGPPRKVSREGIAREVETAAQGAFDDLVILALSHPRVRAHVLAIVAEAMAPEGGKPPSGKPQGTRKRRTA